MIDELIRDLETALDCLERRQGVDIFFVLDALELVAWAEVIAAKFYP